MTFNIAVMADGNARIAVLDLLDELNITIEDFLDDISLYRTRYSESLLNVYRKNALWYGAFTTAFLNINPGSDVVLFVYNSQNLRREHHQVIEETILSTGQEIIDTLHHAAEVYIVGSAYEKDKWLRIFPTLKELTQKGKTGENRVILVVGYECGIGECQDSSVKYLRDVDVFLRATQSRVSGMFFPAMNNALFFYLNNTSYMYDPIELSKAITRAYSMDEEHDDANLYSGEVYKAWKDQRKRGGKLYATLRALPPVVIDVTSTERR